MSKIINTARGAKNVVKSIASLFFVSKSGCHLGSFKVSGRQECVILGNGPSLKKTIANYFDFIKSKKVLCVNDFAHSPHFIKLKPNFYCLIDPAFWDKNVSPKLKKMYEEYRRIMVEKVNWPMVIFLPMRAKHWNIFMDVPKLNKNIKICYLNTTILYGPLKFNHFFYHKNLAMPAAQNVLVASIFAAINLGFRKVYLVGADHSWHESFFVDDDNKLYLVNKRFQDKKKVELSHFYLDPAETIPYQMHNLLKDLSRMYESYLELESYSKTVGVKVYNASEKSYIDAFKRIKLGKK